MSPAQFLAAFDRNQWLVAGEIADRLNKADYWQPCWPPLSPQEKIDYVERVCRTWTAEDGVPMIIAREAQVYPDVIAYEYKPTDALAEKDYRELLGIHHERLYQSRGREGHVMENDEVPMSSLEDDDCPF
jgi:hypothetical protein